MAGSAATRSAERLHPRDRAPSATSSYSRWQLRPSSGTSPSSPGSTAPGRAFLVLLFVTAFLAATAGIYGTPGAASASRPQCNNRMDDDGDGKIDYPTDPGCTGKGDKSEADPVQPPPPPPPPPSGCEGLPKPGPAAAMSLSFSDCFDTLNRNVWANRQWWEPAPPLNAQYVQDGVLHVVTRRSQGYQNTSISSEPLGQANPKSFK